MSKDQACVQLLQLNSHPFAGFKTAHDRLRSSLGLPKSSNSTARPGIQGCGSFWVCCRHSAAQRGLCSSWHDLHLQGCYATPSRWLWHSSSTWDLMQHSGVFSQLSASLGA